VYKRQHFDSRLNKVRIDVACDVKNPLLGLLGSARTYGPQKGASPKQVLLLEKALGRWSRFARMNIAAAPGAGAAGALAFGLAGFAGARLVDGARLIMEAVHWQAAAQKADFIVTGEGRLDPTSFSGKVIGAICRQRGRARVAVICGFNTVSLAHLKKMGIDFLVEMGPKGLASPQKSLARAARALHKK